MLHRGYIHDLTYIGKERGTMNADWFLQAALADRLRIVKKCIKKYIFKYAECTH